MTVSINEFKNDELVGHHFTELSRFDSWQVLTYVRKVWDLPTPVVVVREQAGTILMNFGNSSHEVCAVLTY